MATLTQCAPETVQAQSVVEVVLALGSNYQAEKYLPIARESLAALGEIRLSRRFKTLILLQPWNSQSLTIPINVSI